MRLYKPAAVIGFLLLAACSPPQEARVQLRVIETTDLHMHIVDYDYLQDQPSVTFGLARTAALLETARAEVQNSVLVDNGDLLQGNALGDFMARQRGLADGAIHPVYKAMNLLDYTVGNIGNHEFNYGLDFLMKAFEGLELLDPMDLARGYAFAISQPDSVDVNDIVIRPTGSQM